MLATFTAERVPAGLAGAKQSTAFSENHWAVTGTVPNMHLRRCEAAKPEPCTLTSVPPASVPSSGVMCVTASSCMYENEARSDEKVYPPSLVTSTSTLPGLGLPSGGETHDTTVGANDDTGTRVGELEKRQKVLPLTKPEPVIVMRVPPRIGPEGGEMEEMVGAGDAEHCVGEIAAPSNTRDPREAVARREEDEGVQSAREASRTAAPDAAERVCARRSWGGDGKEHGPPGVPAEEEDGEEPRGDTAPDQCPVEGPRRRSDESVRHL